MHEHTLNQMAYLQEWESAMRCGLINGRPFSEVCISTYRRYVHWFLTNQGELSVQNIKRTLLQIPVENFAKRLKLFQSLMCFARYLVEEKQLEPALIEEARRYKPKRHLPPRKLVVNQSELDKLLKAAYTQFEVTLVTLLSQTGLRINEASNLKLTDLDFENKVLTIRLAKWGKTRRVGMTQEVIEVLQDYILTRPKVKLDWLFINSRFAQMDRFGMRNRLDRLGKRAGVKVTPHSLRRAFVTINANKGRPLVMLQIACGHSDITTTSGYCMTTEQETVDAMSSWQ